jgi:hypothetical protein
MSYEDRSINLIGMGIGDRPVFKPPPKRSNDVKRTQVPDSSPTYEEERAKVEVRRKMKQDVRRYLVEREREEIVKDAIHAAQKSLEKPEGPQRPTSD